MLRRLISGELGPFNLTALAAVVVLAVFTWTERTVLVDPDGLSAAYWPWRLWQLPPLLIALGGAWWIWLSSERSPQVPGTALALLALAVVVNAYTGGFGEQSGNVWRTLNPLYIACSNVAAVNLWQHRGRQYLAGAAAAAALGAIVFVNAYFLNEPVIWQLMNPLMILTALMAAAGLRAYGDSTRRAGQAD